VSVITQKRAIRLSNFLAGKWLDSTAGDFLPVIDPATQAVLAEVPLSSAADVDAVVAAAAAAFPEWRRTPPEERIQFLFRMKALLEENVEEIARTCTRENGKTLAESRAEVRRAIENVEVACGIPTLMQGYNLEDVARGIDEMMVRQPLGVVAAITPFNFPAMIPFWFLPYAIACGNTFVLKPSERVPLTMRLVFELLETIGLPPGVVNLVNGAKEVVDALLAHPQLRAVSFVGSTAVARYVYAQGAAYGKRVQCQGGAKNHVVVTPEADLANTTQVVIDSAFGCAGQRCLAVSTVIAIGEARKPLCSALAESAVALRVGNGLEEGVQMGPVISSASKLRIEGLIAQGVADGGKLAVDGRGQTGSGNFLCPTILEDVPPQSALTSTEIFGPVLSLVPARDLDDAIAILNRSAYGNAASIFTTSGAEARKFRYEVGAGNVGVNIGVAAPMAYFPFSGWKDSFLGALHGQGRDAVEFYTDKKVVIERWPKAWSRKF
jgi:malonate-semialdehyde dehydrogenase (acetylating)/methylmalonate-semialdehyde dehydrogenase